MIFSDQTKKTRSIQASPWIILGSAAILLIVVLILAVQNYNREKAYMSRILSEKGAALIRAVEAGARTGMMGMHWGGAQVQSLLEETARFPDVHYLMVVQKDGRILAHSEPGSIGSTLERDYSFGTLNSSGEASWAIIDTKKFGRSFEVYRIFKPILNRERFRRGRMGRMMGRMRSSQEYEDDWSLGASKGGKEQIILVGLNIAPFEEARAEDIRNTIVISGVLALLGLAGFVSIFWMHNYQAAKQSLSDTSAFTEELAANLPVGLIATDDKGKIAYFNSAAEKITSVDFSNAMGVDPEKILPRHICGLKEALDRGEMVSEREMECEFVQGARTPVSITASSIVNQEGHFVGSVMIIKDLKELRRLQDEVRQKEKLAALGGLAAGVAHEIRNPLSSIKGMASYLGSKFANDSEDRKAANVMIQEVDRLNRVISELLEFARPARLKPKKIDVNEILEHSVKLVQKEAFSKNIEIRCSLSERPLICLVDPDRFSQCLLNLFINAFQAMGSGGELTVKCFSSENGFAGVDIRDTGPGIWIENMTKIFDPYFTTKAKGTGLGLAIAHKIVEAHGGTIKARNASRGGAVFSILLPMQPDSRG